MASDDKASSSSEVSVVIESGPNDLEKQIIRQVEMASDDKASSSSEMSVVIESGPNDLEKQIIRQVEYYFGDFNLRRDQFLLMQIKLDDGWIPLDTMLKFRMLAKLTKEPKVILDALSHSQLMEVFEEGGVIKIRRSPEHPILEQNEQRKNEIEQRTVYLEGFPLDTDIDTLLNFVNRFEPIDGFLVRKYRDEISKSFKFDGSIYLTLTTFEKAKEIIAMENLKYNDRDLIKKWKKQYMEERKQKTEGKALKGAKNTKVKVNEPRLKTGTVLHLTGNFKRVSREGIRTKLSVQNVKPAFVLFNKGDVEAYVRYNEENAAKWVFKQKGTAVKISGHQIHVRLLEGDEEIEFLKKSIADQKAFFLKQTK